MTEEGGVKEEGGSERAKEGGNPGGADGSERREGREMGMT